MAPSRLTEEGFLIVRGPSSSPAERSEVHIFWRTAHWRQHAAARGSAGSDEWTARTRVPGKSPAKATSRSTSAPERYQRSKALTAKECRKSWIRGVRPL